MYTNKFNKIKKIIPKYSSKNSIYLYKTKKLKNSYSYSKKLIKNIMSGEKPQSKSNAFYGIASGFYSLKTVQD